jgi:hypothetical protein
MSLSRALCRVGRSLLSKKPLQLRTRTLKATAASSYQFSKVSSTSILLIRRNFCAIEEMSFQFKVDAFGSIAIDHKTLPNDEIVFGKHLERTCRVNFLAPSGSSLTIDASYAVYRMSQGLERSWKKGSVFENSYREEFSYSCSN